MRRNRILKVIALLGAVCFTAGCSGSGAATAFEKEFEITDWTMEDLVSDMTLCGEKITLPCTISELAGIFSIEEFDTTNAATGKRSKGCIIYHNGKKIALAYCDTDSDTDSITSICFDEIITDDMAIPDIKFMGITDKASSKDLVEMLGEPNGETEYSCDYRYYFSDNQHLYISFDENQKKILYIAVVYKPE